MDKSGFKKKKELFSDVCDKNKAFMDWKRDLLAIELQKKNEINMNISNSSIKINERMVETSKVLDNEKKRRLLPPYYTLMTTYRHNKVENNKISNFLINDSQKLRRNHSQLNYVVTSIKN